MLVNKIREKFLQFFAAKGHTIVASSSLVPLSDPTLLFTNAGMNQFKDVFLGLDTRNYTRATSAQKCVRAGGKHNDLENVGYTARHHTFFEMLGNFSFGDYFKSKALAFAWEFLTQTLAIPPDKLYVTVYHTDTDAFDIWHKQIGLTTDRIIKIGDKPGGGSDNFWQMGDTGPCGPCSEIFYDHGSEIAGGLPGSANEDGDRYVEIWNCVFMQFNRDNDGTLHPLPKPSVDTGMGLERIAAVLQHVHSNYDIDLFTHLIKRAAHITNCSDLHHNSLKVLADHIRATSFLIADGVIPDNEGRGYVLRRIMRRAIRHGYKLGARAPFFSKLVAQLVAEMGNAYPELIQQQQNITLVIVAEEEKFFTTINNGMELLHQELAQFKNKTLAGDIAFKLYDTYGFPLDLTSDICREQGIQVDTAAFDAAMARQKSMARAAAKFKADAQLEYNSGATGFLGYTDNSITASIIALYKDNQPVTKLSPSEEGIVVLDNTSFYAESGGQIGDSGVIQIDGGATSLFVVDDTQKIKSDAIAHIGRLTTGTLKIGDVVTATIDLHRRLATARNHSATHLLHKALHEVLGTHALQKGSLVNSEYTRFDFAHNKPVTYQELRAIERIVNHVIMNNYPVTCTLMKYDAAITSGATALFGEKYADDVRVISMGEFSTELCGGTHVERTGDIGLFIIISEAGVAGGVRRIEAITGEAALQYMQDNRLFIDDLRSTLKAQNLEVAKNKLALLLDEKKTLTKQISTLTTSLASSRAQEYILQVTTLNNGHKLLAVELKPNDAELINQLVEHLKNTLTDTVILMHCRNNDKIELVAGVTADLINTYKANAIINHLATVVDARGGGRADLAKAQGAVRKSHGEILDSVTQYLIKVLNGFQSTLE